MHDLDATLEHDLLRAELVSLPLALVVLLLVFRTRASPRSLPVGVGGARGRRRHRRRDRRSRTSPTSPSTRSTSARSSASASPSTTRSSSSAATARSWPRGQDHARGARARDGDGRPRRRLLGRRRRHRPLGPPLLRGLVPLRDGHRRRDRRRARGRSSRSRSCPRCSRSSARASTRGGSGRRRARAAAPRGFWHRTARRRDAASAALPRADAGRVARAWACRSCTCASRRRTCACCRATSRRAAATSSCAPHFPDLGGQPHRRRRPASRRRRRIDAHARADRALQRARGAHRRAPRPCARSRRPSPTADPIPASATTRSSSTRSPTRAPESDEARADRPRHPRRTAASPTARCSSAARPPTTSTRPATSSQRAPKAVGARRRRDRARRLPPARLRRPAAQGGRDELPLHRRLVRRARLDLPGRPPARDRGPRPSSRRCRSCSSASCSACRWTTRS